MRKVFIYRPFGKITVFLSTRLLVCCLAILIANALGQNQPPSSPSPSPTDPASSPRLPLKLTERREARVNCVAFAPDPQDPSKMSGAVSPLTVRVEPNTTGNPSVGISEEFVSSVGDQWRSSAWLAAFNACQVLNIPVTDVEVLFQTRGAIDGPSAGMLMTSTLLALLHGDTPRADTTITGTINPDGSSGPVGGIPLKIEGAKAKGLKRFGFPIGIRMSLDPRTNTLVDVVEKAQQEGLEVREIRDIYHAYNFLTD